MDPGVNIHFFFQDVSITLDDRARLKAFISKLFKKERKRLKELNYIFCTDKELLRINREFLDHDFYTDIVTFDLSEDPTTIQGEIYISSDRIRANALDYKTTIKQELHRVIFHGAFRLCGYKDKTKAQMKLMRQKEDSTLTQYFN